MERNFNEDRRFKLYGDKLFSIHASNNLIIETSYNNIDFCSNAVIFDGHVELNRVICNNISISNVSEISSNFVYVNNIDLPSNNKLKYNSVNNGYIRNTSIGIDNTSYTIGRSDAYFTYINVSGGDASFNTNLTINKDLLIDGTLTISNDLLINGSRFASIENSFNIYRAALEQNFYSAKIVTNDLSASAISISNNLVALKTAYFNDISINGQLLNNVLKVPALFTIDPSGHGNASGTLIINGDLTVNGLQTSIASSVVDICDQAITLASNLANIQDLPKTLMQATGGTVTSNGGYTIHSFTTVGTTTFTVTSPGSIDYIVVAGGGSGGAGRGGGGGAGGVSMGTTTLSAGSYTITVGAGGISAGFDAKGNNGGSSSIGTLIVTTGGGGGGGWSTPTGQNGGSGGGQNGGNGGTIGLGISGQGFNGSPQVSNNIGGGGGGAGGAGLGSTGGIGISSTLTGTTRYYAGGGGAGRGGNSATTSNYGLAYGGTYQVANGTYGGGNGTNTAGIKQPFQDAVANTGGGGGGQQTSNSGAGGSGIVIIRYLADNDTTRPAGLYISNIASLKYNGTLWNFGGGQLTVQNNKVLLIDDVSLAKRDFDLSINTFRSDFSSSFFALKKNIDNSYNATYSRNQITNKFILKSNFDISSTSLLSYVDSSYISKSTFTISYGDILTLMDTSYVEQRRVGALNPFTSSFNTFNEKLDISYLLNSVFEASHNKIKTDFDISFATINASNITTSASSITIENINTKHSSQIFTNSLWNQLGLDFSSIPNNKINNNKNVVISNDGNVVAYSLNDNLSVQQVDQAVSTWTRSTVLLANQWSGICWSPELGLFVAIAWGGTNNRVMTSPNGITWTPRYTADANAWRFVCWSPQLRLFVAIAYSGTNRVMTSLDGITWTGQSQGIEANSWRAVCWSPELGLFAAISDDGNNRAMTSPNGITWTPRTTPETNGWISICWSPELGLFVAVGSASVSVVMTSNNGINWTARTVSGANAYTWHGVCWSKELGLFVAVAHGGNRVLTSNNGINWSMIILPFSNNNNWTGVCWSGELGIFVAIAQEGTNRVMTSPDGINWTSRTAVESMYWYGICWSPELGIFAAVAWSGASQVMTSLLPTTTRAGSVYVYELSYNNWSKLGSNTIVGLSGDELGYSLALSSNGRIVAASSLYKDASAGQVRVYELSNNTNSWVQKGSNINGPRPGSESGYSISLAGSGNRIAIGAWKDNSNGTNAGAVRVYDFSNISNVADWRQQGQTIVGISGSFEGYSTALSLDGQTLASGSILGRSTGGTLSISGGYIIHSFTTVGTSYFTPAFSGSVEVLIVGGGGGGGPSLGGGGGAGGVIYIPSTNVILGASYEIVVGDGGASGTNGQQSRAFTAIAAGGGTGASHLSLTGNGADGGCGGGAVISTYSNTILYQGGAGKVGSSLGQNSGFIYGASGGSIITTRSIGQPTRQGGGGGAGGAALNTSTIILGDTGRTGASSGGVGVVNAILGPSYYWGGGGGGAAWDSQVGGYGGLGGGGGGCGNNGGGSGGGSALTDGSNGLLGNNTKGGDGGTNTGGGGGGGNYNTGLGGKGGSGIVVIRYLQSVTGLNIGRGQIKTFTISGNTWTPKGTIQGPDISNLYFGRSMKLSANGNAIVIGAPGYATEYRINPIYELNTTTMNWLAHRTNALTVFGRDLAVILDASQNAQVNVLRNGNQAYLGGRRKTTSVNANGKTAVDWEWVTGDAWNYTAFPSNQPDTITENVIHMWYTDGGWNDIVSGSQLTAIYMYYKAQAFNTGQAYVYGYQGGTTWTQLGQAIVGLSGGDEFGSSVSMSNDGTLISVGSNNNNYNRGQVRVFSYINNYWYQLSNSINGKISNSKAGIHALSGDGRTLIQTNNTYNSVYGLNRSLAFIPSTTTISTTISGDLAVTGKAYLKSFRISNKHNFDVSINGYSSHYLVTTDISASIVDYYSNVGYIYNKVFKIDACGNVSNYSGLYGAVSDSRLKENIVTSSPKLADLLKVRVVNYNLKGSDKTKYIGVLAQELEELFPELVVEDNTVERIKSVNYSNLTIMLIKAFQEQQVLINNLYACLECLEN